MSKRLAFWVLVALAAFSLVFPAAAAENNENPALLLEVMELVEDYHLSNPEPGAITGGAIQGIMYELDDPYADYFDPEALKGFTDALNGDLIGIGVELISRDGYPAIISVFSGTPAQQGGLQAGDLIMAVDGSSTAGWSLAEVATAIRGLRDTSVVLTIRRGEKEFDVALQRAEVHVPSVYSELMEGQTGYIAVSTFGAHTTVEFETALKDLRRQGISSLVIDLRGNGGGYLYEAIDIADNFLPAGSVVVFSEDNRGHTEEIRTESAPTVTDLPIVVITDAASASASEILAGALRDHGLAKLVGDVTYGKGVVQTIFPLSNGGALKITTARYLTPAGTDINSTGLSPDHGVLTPALQKEVAWQFLNPQDAPDLSFAPEGEVLLNGRKTGLVIEPLDRGNREYLPARMVLESMLYEVYWDRGELIAIDGKNGQNVNRFGMAGPDGSPDVVLNHGISYIAVDLYPQLNINIKKEGKVYKLERWL